MLQKALFVQYAFIFVISFVSGVICFQAFSMDKAMKLIQIVDPRIINVENITIWHTIIPLCVWIVIVLLFATHQFLHPFAPLVVGVKATFFGFSSVFLLTQQQSLLFYSAWWFPFQLLYCFLLFMLCMVQSSKKVGPNRKSYFLHRLLMATLFLFTLICAGEILAISYIFH